MHFPLIKITSKNFQKLVCIWIVGFQDLNHYCIFSSIFNSFCFNHDVIKRINRFLFKRVEVMMDRKWIHDDLGVISYQHQPEAEGNVKGNGSWRWQWCAIREHRNVPRQLPLRYTRFNRTVYLMQSAISNLNFPFFSIRAKIFSVEDVYKTTKNAGFFIILTISQNYVEVDPKCK